MIIEGLKLTILGMGVVFAFLVLLYVVIELTHLILKNATSNEEKFISSRNVPAKRFIPARPDVGRAKNEGEILAVIAAAVKAHREKSRALH